jgi:outer membrane lipoprotein
MYRIVNGYKVAIGTGLVFWTGICLLLSGCVSGISKQARSRVTYNGSFIELQTHVEANSGAVVLLGGRILDIKQVGKSTEITVLQMPLDNRDRPQNSDRSQGRFLVQADRHLDPEVFEKGLRIAVVGKVVGADIRTIDAYDYTFPKLQAIEIKLWPPKRQSAPDIRFVFGVQTSF